MTTSLPAPDGLRRRIEVERDTWRTPRAASNAGVEVSLLMLARCESALRRLDRHGGDHWCIAPTNRADWRRPEQCVEYLDLCAEYPA